MTVVPYVLPLLVLSLGCATRSEDVGPLIEAASEPGESFVDLATATGTLYGTLLLPEGAGPLPVALIVAGSGPTDRDGNSPVLPGRNNSLKLLAEGLAERGIATLRYDKRGIAASAAAGPQEEDVRFDTYVHDAASWVSWLRADPRFSTVSIIGHSEGSLIGIMAGQHAEIDAFVSVAGPARPAAEVLREQLRPQLPGSLWEESERILNSLLEGRTVVQVSPELMALYRPSVQPYLISWMGLNPAMEIARVEAPVLIAQGSTDVQVSVSDAHSLRAARAGSEMIIVEGMNHVLKLVPADMAQQQASYSNPALPVAPQLIERVSAFLLGVAR